MRIIVFFLLLLVSSTAFAQIEITNIVHQSNSELPVLNGFPIVAEDENGFSVFLMDGNKIFANGFDEDYKYLDRLQTREVRSNEEYIAGKSYGDSYHLLFKVRSGSRINVQTFNFNERTVTESDIQLDIRDQEILQFFEYKNTIKLLTVGAKDENLYLHTIDENLHASSIEIPIATYTFFDANQKQRPFHRIIFDDFETVSGIGMGLSQRTFPITLPESTRLTKIYRQQQQLIITLDASARYTQVLYVDIDSGDTKLINIEKAAEIDAKRVKKSNSFVLDDQLYQIVRKGAVLEVFVKNISSKKLLKHFTLSEDEERFMHTNTATLTLKPSKKKRKKVTPNQFLRLAKNNPLGIYAKKTDGSIQITYGSWAKERGNKSSLNNNKASSGNAATIGAMTAMFGIAGGLMYAALTTTNAVQSYGLHHVGMTTRAVGVFDQNLEHLPEKGVKATIYHKIDYYNYRKEGTTPLLLFEFQGTPIYGSFYPNQNAIKLLKF